MFGLEKMIVVGQNNLRRIHLYWDSLSAYLDCICNSKYAEIRVLGISSLSRIIMSAFKCFSETPPESSSEKWQHWQRTVLLSLHDLLSSNYQDTHESIYKILFPAGSWYSGASFGISHNLWFGNTSQNMSADDPRELENTPNYNNTGTQVQVVLTTFYH